MPERTNTSRREFYAKWMAYPISMPGGEYTDIQEIETGNEPERRALIKAGFHWVPEIEGLQIRKLLIR